jgi:hypothetical protein
VIDWDHNATVGYLLHLKAKSGSGANASVVGIGTDGGAANGLLVSHKNSGAGVRVIQHALSAYGMYLNGYSATPLVLAEIFKGSGGIKIAPTAGQGFGDGATTSGSNVFTSATAAFTGADVGAALTQATQRGATDPAGSIPSGTTIVSVTNATTVAMSNVSPSTSSAVIFTVGGRLPDASQVLLRMADESDVTLASFRKGDAFVRVPLDLTTNVIGSPSLRVNGMAGQTADIFQAFRNGNATAMFSVLPAGLGAFRAGLSVNNGQTTTQTALTVTNLGTGVKTMQLTGVSGQTLDQLSMLDSGGATQSRFDKNGHFHTHKTSAPADADIANGSVALWFDSTNGAAKLMIKGRSANGTVVSGSVALA